MISRAHQLVSMLRDYEKGILEKHRNVDSLLALWSSDELAGSAKFVCGRGNDIPYEMMDFGYDLVERGLFKIPNNSTIFEFEYNEKFGEVENQWLFVLAKEWRDGITIYPITFAGRDGFFFPDTIGTVEDNYLTSYCFGEDEAARFSWLDDEKGRSFAKALSCVFVDMAGKCVLSAVVAMISKSTVIDTVPAPEKLNRQRLKKGRVPLFEYKRVVIDARKPATGWGGEGGHHASPRLHWRRGHYRRLGGERLIPVAPCLVGMAENGVIEKEYALAFVTD